jgi:hypothetical protein
MSFFIFTEINYYDATLFALMLTPTHPINRALMMTCDSAFFKHGHSTIIILSMNVGSVGKLNHTNTKQNSGHKM